MYFRLRLFHGFFADAESRVFFDELFHGLPWRQRSDVKDGQSYLQPRLTAWYGDHAYAYSGVKHQANPQVGFYVKNFRYRHNILLLRSCVQL